MAGEGTAERARPSPGGLVVGLVVGLTAWTAAFWTAITAAGLDEWVVGLVVTLCVLLALAGLVVASTRRWALGFGLVAAAVAAPFANLTALGVLIGS